MCPSGRIHPRPYKNMDVVLCLDFIEKKPLQILMSEEALKADVSKYATVP